MQEISFQLLYAATFYEIVKLKFHLKNSDIKFFSSAYNLGFHRTKNEIMKHSGKNTFPYGSK